MKIRGAEPFFQINYSNPLVRQVHKIYAIANTHMLRFFPVGVRFCFVSSPSI